MILIGLLTGLLFSCGEGIQLLPFPETGVSGDRLSEITCSTRYNKNVLRFEKKPEKDPTRSQYHGQAAAAAAASLAPGLRSLIANDDGNDSTRVPFTHNGSLTSAIRDRAPPVS